MKYLLLILLMPMLFGCNSGREKETERIKTIKVKEVQPYYEERIFSYAAKTVASEEYNVAFRLSGMIENIPVKTGQTIRKNEVIAVLDCRDYQTQLQATEAKYNQIKSEADRISELYKRGSVSPNDYEKSISELTQISAQLKAQEDALADCYLRAPANGKIEKIYFKKGETVASGMPVISMLDNETQEVEIFVPAEIIPSLKTGEASFEKIKNYPLTLLSIAPKSNAGGLYKVNYILSGNHPDLLTGEVGNVIIRNKENTSSPAFCSIPADALFRKEEQTMVWIFQPQQNQVQLMPVQTIKMLSDGDVVVSGLQSGEQVVIAGVNSINESMKLQALPEKSQTNIGDLK